MQKFYIDKRIEVRNGETGELRAPDYLNEITDFSEWTLDDRTGELVTAIDIHNIDGCILYSVKYLMSNVNDVWYTYRTFWKKHKALSRTAEILDTKKHIYTDNLVQCIQYCLKDWNEIKVLIDENGEINETKTY